MFLFSSFLWSLHLSLPCTCVCSLFWLCVSFSFFFFKNFGFAIGGQRRSQRLDPDMAGLGQGAGPRLLRGSLCLKPLRISYCSSQGAGWGLAEGFLVAASPRVQATGAPCQARLGGRVVGRVSWEHFPTCQPKVWLVFWAPCPSQAPTLGANWVFGKFLSSMVL